MSDKGVESRSDGIHRIHWRRTDSNGKVHDLLVRVLEKYIYISVNFNSTWDLRNELWHVQYACFSYDTCNMFVLIWLMAQLDFRRFYRNRCVSNGSNGLHRTTFQPFSSQRVSKYCCLFWLMARIDFRRLHRYRCVSNGPKDSIGLLSNPSPLRESQSIFRLDSIGLPDIAVSFGVVFWRDVVEVKVQWIQQNANDKIKLTCYCRAAEEIKMLFTFGNN